MFYSQFILAKKGPLGTIWIAAHLERKLRKNQVADTDIGVSVDSILFPDVPIALRLSSHLLLGVVRIYSRKVNYLFDDCSEALLKIKQAFRSTAVDLPPEESTAPYHSITLPETFDLDDFELPDSDIFQGNYVDHHVSTKEQITLQDTMDGVVYSTSKFGLDERFGDGDTSQVALDLEEDMFLDKVTSRPGEIPEGNAGTSGAAPASLMGSSARLPVDGMAVNLEAGDYAQAPSTPGLVNEPNLSSVQERLASDDHLESEDHNLTESLGIESRDNASVKLDLHCGDTTEFSPDHHASDDPMGTMAMALEGKEPVSADLEVVKERGNSPANGVAVDDVEDQNKIASNNEPGMHFNRESEEYIEVRLCDLKDTGGDNEGQEAHSLGRDLEEQACLKPEETDTNNNNNRNEQSGSSSISVLRACSSLSDTPLEDGPCILDKDGELDPSETAKNIQGEEHVDTDNGQVEKVLLHGPDSAMPSDSQFGELDGSMTSELPAPEKMLSAPQTAFDMPVSLLMETTPDKEDLEEVDGTSTGDKVSAKKRTFMDSTEPMQSMNTAETFNRSKSRRTIGSIPDDDDLLSSILAGRRSSILKIKSSPTAPEVVSRKRIRSTSRASAMKRKVLVDDSMILLGDTIRQQLTQTEDIRRLRKKAPCTRAEIVVIQRQFLEEEIFSEPVLTGMALELTRLHTEKLDLSGILVTENDGNMGLLETGQGKESSARPPLTEEGSVPGATEPSTSKDVRDEQCNELLAQGEGGEILPEDVDHQGDTSGIDVIADIRALEVEPFGERIVEIDQANNSLILREQASGSIAKGPVESGDEPTLVDKTVGEDEMGTRSDRIAPLSSTISGENLDGMNILGNCTDSLSVATADLGEGEESLPESKADEPVELTTDPQRNGDGLTDDAGLAFVNVLSEKDGCMNSPLNVAEAPELESDKLSLNEERDVAVSLGYDDKDKISTYSNEDCKLGAGPDTDIKYGSFHDIDYVDGCHPDQQGVMDPGRPSIGYYAEGHCVDSQGIPLANDTEFLNVDDDEMAEDDDGIAGAEDTHLFDNSGWSSRTRAVANYLQTLFDKEAVSGRKVLSVDNLLAGKTRKEASRMFFETLVLKTKDYIHVEQEKPFDNINIKARAKLMKSDF